MSIDLDKAKIVSETADNLGVDKLTKSAAVMSAAIGATDSAVRILGMGINSMETAKAEAANPKPKNVGKYTRTEKKLIDMMQESTGTHFLDSGGAYGRNWQRNRQKTDWHDIEEKDVRVETWKDGEWTLSITTNIFPYLANRLSVDTETNQLNRLFNRFSQREDQKGEGWFYVMEAFGDYLKEIYEDIDVTPSFNTYNGDSTLSQVLQGITFELNGSDYVILQIHNGCDVRGGYTKPYIFKCSGDSGVPDFIFDEQDIYASCKCITANSDDCGYNWYVDGSTAKNEYQDGKYKLPNIWQPKELKDNSPLICSKCKVEVGFS